MKISFQTVVWRIFIVALCAVSAWGAGVSAIVNITTNSNSAFALQLVPNDPNALVAKVDAEFSKANIGQRALLSNYADVETSLRGQAVNAFGLRQLGLIADAKGKVDDARALIKLSTKLSRRDLASQLWLVEDGVRSDDIGATMSHYDIALRTSAESAAILHPILGAALADEIVQKAFVPYLRVNPPWMESFLSFAINGGSPPIAVSEAILKGGGLPDIGNYHVLDAQMLQQLVAKGAFFEAFRYYARLDGTDPRVTTSTAFEKAEIAPEYVPLTWQTLNSPGVEASFEPSEKGSARQLHIIVSSGERAPVLRKLMGLAPGIYRFSQKLTPVRLSNGASAYWQLLCFQNSVASMIWRSDVDATEVLIPATCKGQYLELVVAGGSDQDGAELIVKAVSLSNIKRN